MPASSRSVRRPRDLSCVLAEDQGLFLDLLSGMPGLRGGLHMVATARTVCEGRAACEKHLPDLLVLDLDLPDGNGLEVAEVLLKTKPEARVMVVSGHAAGFVCPEWLNGNLQVIIDKNETLSSLRAELDQLLALGETTAKPLPVRKKLFAPRKKRSTAGTPPEPGTYFNGFTTRNPANLAKEAWRWSRVTMTCALSCRALATWSVSNVRHPVEAACARASFSARSQTASQSNAVGRKIPESTSSSRAARAAVDCSKRHSPRKAFSRSAETHSERWSGVNTSGSPHRTTQARTLSAPSSMV